MTIPITVTIRRKIFSLDAMIILVLVGLCAVLLLFRIAALPMQVWDESRNANDALSMASEGHWLVPYFQNNVDHWNTKPPLLIWMIAGLLKFGADPLIALRLPSAVAAFGSLGVVWWACRIGLKDRLAALFSGLALLTSSIYMGEHGASSGNYDALESFFVIVYSIAMWCACESGPENHGPIKLSYLALFAGALFLALMTKGIAAALPLPGIVAFAAIRGHLGKMALNWRVWLICVAPILAILAYYGTRDLYDPGYLAAVQMNELGGRFSTVVEGHEGGPFFYMTILEDGFLPAVYALPLALILLRQWRGPRTGLGLMAATSAGSLLMVLSLSKTKIDWYVVPAVPALSILAGVGLSEFVALLTDFFRQRALHFAALYTRILIIVGVLIAFAFAAQSLYAIQDNHLTASRRPHSAQLSYGAFLESLRKSKKIDSVVVVDGGLTAFGSPPDYDPILVFYAKLLTQQGMPVSIVSSLRLLPVDEFISSCDPLKTHQLLANSRFHLYDQSYNCVLGKISTTVQRNVSTKG